MGEAIGTRVEVPVWSDRWMRGDRYGVVIDASLTDDVLVKLDKSGFTRWFPASNCRVI